MPAVLLQRNLNAIGREVTVSALRIEPGDLECLIAGKPLFAWHCGCTRWSHGLFSSCRCERPSQPTQSRLNQARREITAGSPLRLPAHLDDRPGLKSGS